MASRGLHHITAIVGCAARTVDFYTRVLGMRLVKRTVSFADPGAHHLYVSDGTDRPGELLSFLVWTGAAPCRRGSGEAERILFRATAASLDWWRDRVAGAGATLGADAVLNGDLVLCFEDPDGVPVGIVGPSGLAIEPQSPAFGIPAGFVLRGPVGVVLAARDADRLGALLCDVLGLRESGRPDGLIRLSAVTQPEGMILLREVGRTPRGRLGRGAINQVAFRAADGFEQTAMVQRLRAHHGIRAMPLRYDHYYQSVSFRDPGGLLLDIATDGPGLTCDEPGDALGRSLCLPPQLEARRNEIEALLPPLSKAASPGRPA
ncbi:VOC family protein [Methylobacterium tarhaniae]|uniref:VOC family protein n=1 Tax=Methylobacterium tarhaniae TaxID=1187852 RepID=UPI003CFE61CA